MRTGSSSASARSGTDYRPRIHLDVYGTLGELFGGDIEATAVYLGELEAAVQPHELLVESFVIAESRKAQIEAFRALRAAIAKQGHTVKIIVDEWCNTLDDIKAFADAEAADYAQIKTPDLGGINNAIEAVLYAREKGWAAASAAAATKPISRRASPRRSVSPASLISCFPSPALAATRP
jgi:methylaspartate ammonia-lyase